MKALKPTQDTNAEVITPAEKNAPFLYAEESGLALFQNRRTSRKFYMDKEDWVDLSLCVSDGWEPVKS
ncbi:MAG: hypothetical protein OEM91_15040 [Hyphomicrobiales bacterium]|nr:hypothetical protein [Hyphomicrobiales bacterium]